MVSFGWAFNDLAVEPVKLRAPEDSCIVELMAPLRSTMQLPSSNYPFKVLQLAVIVTEKPSLTAIHNP